MDTQLRHISRPRLALSAARQFHLLIARARAECRTYAQVLRFRYDSKLWVEGAEMRALADAGLVRQVGLGVWGFTTQGANVVTDRGRLCGEGPYAEGNR